MKLKTIFKLISIAILIIMLFPHSTVLAASVAEVGNAIGTFALNYYNKKGTTECPYVNWYNVNLSDQSSYGKRAMPAKVQSDGEYYFDCVGWVNFCVYNATGIGTKDGDNEGVVLSGAGGYVVPGNTSNRTSFDVQKITSSSELQTGDIIIESTHVSVFVREGNEEYVIESINDDGPFKNKYSDVTESGAYFARVNSSVAEKIDASELTTNPLLGGTAASNKNLSDFYYNGIPDGKYSVTSVNVLEWIIDALKNIFSFLINLITYIVRMVFVGWTFIVEELFTAIIKGLTGEDEILEPDATDYGENGNKFTDDNITIDKIIFDEVKVFDINFFKSKTAEEATEE